MPFSKTVPLSVPSGVNDLEETAMIRREGNEVRIEGQSNNLSQPRSVLLSQLNGVTAQERAGFRAVLRAARVAWYVADGYSES